MLPVNKPRPGGRHRARRRGSWRGRCGGRIFVLAVPAVGTFPPLAAPPPPSLAWYFSTRLAGDESAALRRPAASRGRGRASERAGAAVLTPPLYLRRQAGSLEGQCTAKDKRSPAPDAVYTSDPDQHEEDRNGKVQHLPG